MTDIRAFIVDSQELEAFSDVLPELINDHYRTEYLSSKLAQRKLNMLAAGALLACFADIGPGVRIICNENGKPHAEGRDHFSISHSDRYTVLALCENEPVGIDIERIGRVTARIINKVSGFDTSSASDLELAREWTRIEAALKQKGTGFYYDPLRLDFDALYFFTCVYGGCCISCASETEHCFRLDLAKIKIEDSKIKHIS